MRDKLRILPTLVNIPVNIFQSHLDMFLDLTRIKCLDQRPYISQLYETMES